MLQMSNTGFPHLRSNQQFLHQPRGSVSPSLRSAAPPHSRPATFFHDTPRHAQPPRPRTAHAQLKGGSINADVNEFVTERGGVSHAGKRAVQKFKQNHTTLAKLGNNGAMSWNQVLHKEQRHGVGHEFSFTTKNGQRKWYRLKILHPNNKTFTVPIPITGPNGVELTRPPKIKRSTIPAKSVQSSMSGNHQFSSNVDEMPRKKRRPSQFAQSSMPGNHHQLDSNFYDSNFY